MININDATKGKSDESTKIEQIGMDQTSNIENEETDDDNIPLNKLYMRRHITKNKALKKQKKKISQWNSLLRHIIKINNMEWINMILLVSKKKKNLTWFYQLLSYNITPKLIFIFIFITHYWNIIMDMCIQFIIVSSYNEVITNKALYKKCHNICTIF